MAVEDRSRLTSGYGWQAWRQYTHTGVDFGGTSPGVSSPVYAAADGVVEIAADGTIPKRTGPQIKLRHPDGSATTYGHTRYCKVRRGQVVRRGDRLADTWHTGLKASAGIHLHFEWWRDSDNYDSHHDPIARLADYGWVIKGGRLYDEWDGRATATPTITPAATTTTPKEDDMTPAQEAKLDRALFLLDSIPKNVWGHEFAHPRTGDATPARAFLASDYANGQAVHAMVAAVAEKSGIDPIEVERIIRDAIEKGLAAGVELEAKINVKEK